MTQAYIAGSINPIDTGDTYFKEVVKTRISGRDVAVREIDRTNIINLPVADARPLDARVEHARWIVDCPNCNGAEFYFEDKLFYCQLCHNSNVDGKTIKVKMHKDRKKIEDILGKRPIKNRHWYPNETIEDLEKQNKGDK